MRAHEAICAAMRPFEAIRAEMRAVHEETRRVSATMTRMAEDIHGLVEGRNDT